MCLKIDTNGLRPQFILLYSLIIVPVPTVIPDIATPVLALISETTWHVGSFNRGLNIGDLLVWEISSTVFGYPCLNA